MDYFRIIAGLTVLVCSLLFSCNVFSEINKTHGVDYSNQLNDLLEIKAKKFSIPYKFKIHRDNNYYNVVIKTQKNQEIKKISESDVAKVFEQHDKTIEKNILDIIFIPGKK